MSDNKGFFSSKFFFILVIPLFIVLVTHLSQSPKEGVIVYIGCDDSKDVKLSPGVYTDAEHLPGLGLRVYKKKIQTMRMDIPKGWTVKIYDHELYREGNVLLAVESGKCHDFSKFGSKIASWVVENPGVNSYLE